MGKSVQLLTYKVSDDPVIRSMAFIHHFCNGQGTVSFSSLAVASNYACLFIWQY